MNVHTPGPWTVSINHATGKPEFIRACIHVPLLSYDGLVNAEMYDIANTACDETGNATANARLICAAPELLAALRDAVALIEDYGLDATPQRAAITKAIGEPV